MPETVSRSTQATAPLEVFCDGLCEPNPGGLATYGFVVCGPAGGFDGGRSAAEPSGGYEIRREKGVAGRGRGGEATDNPPATNNFAEYTAAIRALRWLLEDGCENNPVILHSDSKLLVNQLSGTWRVQSPAIAPLWQEARGLAARFSQGVRPVWVPREENRVADALSVEAYVETLEAERAPRADGVRLEDLGKGLYLANARYRTDALFGACECRDHRQTNRGRFRVRCKHLLRAAREWPHPPITRPRAALLARGRP